MALLCFSYMFCWLEGLTCFLTPVHTISRVTCPIHRCSGVPTYYSDSGSTSYLDFIDSEVISSRLSKLSRDFLSNCLLTSKWQKNYKICYKHCPIQGHKAVEGGVTGIGEQNQADTPFTIYSTRLTCSCKTQSSESWLSLSSSFHRSHTAWFFLLLLYHIFFLLK